MEYLFGFYKQSKTDRTFNIALEKLFQSNSA